MSESPVVITGLGAVTPVGLDQPSTWAALVAGQSGLGPFTRFDPAAFGLATRACGEVKGFDPLAWINQRQARRMDRVIQFGMAAASEALADAGLLVGVGSEAVLDDSVVPADRIGVFIGSGVGGVTTLLAESDVLRERGGGRVSPFLLPMVLIDSIPGAVAIAFGLRGPNIAHVSACASGANAIGDAFKLIQRGERRRDGHRRQRGRRSPTWDWPASPPWAPCRRATTTRRAPAARSTATATASSSARAPGILVLEELEHAKARGARIYAEMRRLRHVGRRRAHHRPRRGRRGAARAMQAGPRRRRRHARRRRLHQRPRHQHPAGRRGRDARP